MMRCEIAFGVDARYVKYAGIAMTSVAMQSEGENVGFHLVCDGIADADRKRLDAFRAAFPWTDVHIYDARAALDEISFPRGISPERINRSVFTRILMPELVPQSLDRILYLDADTLCVGHMGTFWSLDLAGAPLAAAPEGEAQRKAARIGMKGWSYFNAGVMLIDLARWRAQQLTAHTFAAWEEYGASFPLLEQDALNYVLDGEFLPIGRKYVQMMDAFAPWDVDFSAQYTIWHFLNEGKPWIRYADPRVREAYWQIVRRSPWSDLTPSEPWETRIAYLAGCHAEQAEDYRTAAQYFHAAAERLMAFYLEHTRSMRGTEKEN